MLNLVLDMKPEIAGKDAVIRIMRVMASKCWVLVRGLK